MQDSRAVQQRDYVERPLRTNEMYSRNVASYQSKKFHRQANMLTAHPPHRRARDTSARALPLRRAVPANPAAESIAIAGPAARQEPHISVGARPKVKRTSFSDRALRKSSTAPLLSSTPAQVARLSVFRRRPPRAEELRRHVSRRTRRDTTFGIASGPSFFRRRRRRFAIHVGSTLIPTRSLPS